MNTRLLPALALALGLPVAAGAATTNSSVAITADWNVTANVLQTGNTYNVTYTTGGDTWEISDISFTANGASANISKVTITVSQNGTSTTYTVWTAGQGNTATMVASGFTTSGDFTITYYYAAGGSKSVGVTTSFTATDLSAVPLPAGGLLLVSALAGAGTLSMVRRRKKA